MVSIGEWNGATPPASMTDVGNCSKFDAEVTEQTLDHFSSRSGLKTKDKSVTIEIGYNLTFDLDEISVNNLKLFLKGSLTGTRIIRANTVLDAEYALQFQSDNPVGPNEKWEFWRMKLSPAGGFSLISDEWSKLSFKGTGLADTANHSTSPYFTVTFGTTTTTTTSTTTTTTTD